jgi:tagatose-1,6-bisphosphate aldolase
MIKKEVKEYKRGNSHTYRINIAKQDNLTGIVSILTVDEYESLQNQIKKKDETLANQDKEIKELYNKIDNHDKLYQKIELLDIEHGTLEKRNDKLIQENTALLRKNKDLENNLSNIDETATKSNELIKNLHKQQDETIKELDQMHHDQLKETYEQFNKDLTKYITANNLQNTALKRILELGFIDLIRNKHKKIAKNQIKEIDKPKSYKPDFKEIPMKEK